MIKKILKDIFEFFYFKNCYLCGKKGDWLCLQCTQNLEYIAGACCDICSRPLISEKKICGYCKEQEYVFISNKSLFLYEGIIKELVYQYKFNHKHYLADFLASLFAKEIKSNFHNFSLITPAPSSSSLFKRKSHMRLIAEILKKKYKLSVVYLLKSKYRKAQKSLNYNQRLYNLKSKIKFTASKDYAKDKKILLIDDIFTTGATSEECAKVLIENGAREVHVLTLALD